jgi:YggT family protein
MDVILVPLVKVTFAIIDLYIYAVVATVFASWFISFDIINPRSPIVGSILAFLYKITEPALRPIRRIMPDTGNFDLAPVVLVFILWFIEMVLERIVIKLV